MRQGMGMIGTELSGCRHSEARSKTRNPLLPGMRPHRSQWCPWNLDKSQQIVPSYAGLWPLASSSGHDRCRKGPRESGRVASTTVSLPTAGVQHQIA
jgi:hypothetical protein